MGEVDITTSSGARVQDTALDNLQRHATNDAASGLLNWDTEVEYQEFQPVNLITLSNLLEKMECGVALLEKITTPPTRCTTGRTPWRIWRRATTTA